MRNTFAQLLNKEMDVNKKIRLITADLGYGILDQVRMYHPKEFYNVGAAEQLMVGAAVGMAQEGLTPVCYSMSSFVLYRPFEILRNYLNHEGTNVKLVGSGRDKDYEHDGISHWAQDDELVLSALPNIQIYKPKDITELNAMWSDFIYNDKPCYLNLKRKS